MSHHFRGGGEQIFESLKSNRKDQGINDTKLLQSNDSEEGVAKVELRGLELYPTKIWKTIYYNQQDWLQVPRALRFVQLNVQGLFQAKIRIQNTSSWNIAYCVRSSAARKFVVKSKSGWIAPGKHSDVLVMSRPGYVGDFGSLCRECFIVLGTPVHFASQLHPKKIRLLWKGFGTKLFPFEAAECHKVNQIIPALDSYMDDYSIIEKASMGNYVAGTHEMDIEWPDKPADPSAFYENWRPTEDAHSILLEVNNQIREWRKAMYSLKLQADGLAIQLKCVIGSALTVGITLALLSMCLPLEERLFGNNGQALTAAPEAKSWWNFF